MLRLRHNLAIAALLALTSAPAPSPRDRQLFDFDWRFHHGDIAAGQALSTADTSWERVDLPHDYMIRGAFDQASPGRADNGYLNGGIGWYRKTFTVPANAKDQRVFIEFEGVYMNAQVWLNGEKVGNRPYGYSTVQYDLTPFVKFGARNVIAVRTDVQQPSSRWYSGAGIYRHVWLSVMNPVHVAQWGVTVTTPSIMETTARVHVRVEVQNQTASRVSPETDVTIRDADGRVVAHASAPQPIPANNATTNEFDITVARPHRWTQSDPYLYTAEARVGTDVARTTFGMRTIAFTADGGLMLNGKHVQMYGVCLHHDLGPLGAAAFDRGIERQLQIMKAMGVNAIRTSHNPPAPALLDLADKMGFVVMDEVFDEWKRNKTRFGYGQFFDEWSERDVRDFVRRDRNHPSIVMWSIGNEIPEQGDTNRTASGITRADSMAARLAAFVRKEDTTRFLTSAMNSPQRALRTGFAKSVDAFGVNYNLGVYPTVKDRPSYASETSSDFSSRDQYNLVLKGDTVAIQNHLNNHVTSYDLEGPGWGNSAELQFKAMRDAPWISGEFVWTGTDYIGEPTPFSWPNRSSSFGIVDLAGFPKDRFYLYQSQWRPELPMVHILPHWNWPDSWRGKAIPVWTYTSGDSAELFLNNKSLGVRAKDVHMAWKVPYEPGTLRARAWKGGRVVAEDLVETTSAPARIELKVDRAEIQADGQDLAFVTVRIVDAKGRLCRADGNQQVHLTLSGGGSIAGVDNGDPTNHEPFVGTPTSVHHQAFNGLEILVIRAPRGAVSMTVSASAEGLAGARASIAAR